LFEEFVFPLQSQNCGKSKIKVILCLELKLDRGDLDFEN